ncbi:hypothetical protein C8Q77DRAFT_1215201 [Trametes polyzona]|nr:hypothetical protein C8Q77DRAFT_1215201 [Trametes polyzona]
MADSVFIVDDHNVDSISYETPGMWFPVENVDAASQGTLTEGVTGAKASLTFAGKLGTDVDPPVVQFSLDGRVVQTTTAPNNGSKNYEYPFLDIESISSAQHLLEFTVIKASTEYPFALDLIAYQPISGAAPTASQQVVTTFLPAPTSTASIAPQGSSSSTPVGAIVGGVIGGVAVLVAAAIAIYFLCFRRRRGGEGPYVYATRAKASDLLDQEGKPTPYEAAPPTVPSTPGYQISYSAGPTSQPSASAYSAPSDYAAAATAAQPYNRVSAYAPSEAPMSDLSGGTSTTGPSHPPSLYVANAGRPVRASPNQGTSKAAEAGLLSVPQPATYHADSGIRFNAAGEPTSSAAAGPSNILAPPDLADVPPTYSEA